MDVVDATLQDFGNTLGIPSLAFNEKGLLELVIERVGTLCIEKTDGLIVLYLLRPLSYPNLETFKKALAFCHPKEKPEIPVSAGMTSAEELVFISHLHLSTFTIPNLEASIEVLKNLHNRIANLAK